MSRAFTRADKVTLMTIESGLSLQPWQFDVLGAFPDEETP